MGEKRILVIDDERYISDIIQTSLRKLGGWIVLRAESGQAGLHLAETERPDAILLDVMMPDMNGFSVLQHLQENEATQPIPVILLTAKVRSSDRSQYDEWQVAGVIAKPFDALSLATQIATLLGWAESSDC
jgi:CheY-like chemotaxis protein